MVGMKGDHGESLGHGVFVMPVPDGELLVVSPHLALGWRVAAGRIPGTAVMWRDSAYEVAARGAMRSGDRWTLRPWPGEAAMRDVVALDAAAVTTLAQQAEEARRRARARGISLLLLPLVGLAPAAVQRELSERWGFSAETATWVSAIAEILAGSLGLVQGLALAFGGDWFLPPWLHWWVVIGPLACVEGVIRVRLAAALQEPFGSVIGLPLRIIGSTPTPPELHAGPEARLVDESAGVLELVSPEYRPDWHHDGVLPFRGRGYRLDRCDREGRSWVYRFVSCEGPVSEGVESLRLRPPARAFRPTRGAAKKPPSIAGIALVTAAVTLGPRADQKRWAAYLEIRPLWLTVAGATAELVGGIVNLGRDLQTGTPILLIVDFVLVGEGLLRLGSAASGQPIGSVFGWLLRPLYLRRLPDPRNRSDEAA